MATTFKPAGRTKYVIEYTNEAGKRCRKAGATDKGVTQRIANDLENNVALRKQGLVDPKDESFRDHEAKPLAHHLDAWHRDMLAKGKTAKHADLSRDRAAKLVAMVKGVSLDKLVPGRKADAMAQAARLLASTLEQARFNHLTSEAIQSALAQLKDEGRSAQTANHFRAAIRAFLKWCHRRGRVRTVSSEGIGAFNVGEDLRHVRRSLTDDKLALLIRSAESGPDRLSMSGPLRSIAYHTAAFTGFRVDELRSLTPESFHLEGPRPFITLTAASAKNRKSTDQLVPSSLIGPLQDWLADKVPGESVFSLHHDTGKAIRTHLEAAGIPYKTEEGAADFHALRVYYVSALIRSGRSIKEVQQLARHAKPETTLKHYAKVSVHDLQGAVESLGIGVQPRTLAATGTDSVTITHATEAIVYGSNSRTSKAVASDTQRSAKPLFPGSNPGGASIEPSARRPQPSRRRAS
jgi:integrase